MNPPIIMLRPGERYEALPQGALYTSNRRFIPGLDGELIDVTSMDTGCMAQDLYSIRKGTDSLMRLADRYKRRADACLYSLVAIALALAILQPWL